MEQLSPKSQLLKTKHLESVVHNRRSPCSLQLEKIRTQSNKDPAQPRKEKVYKYSIKHWKVKITNASSEYFLYRTMNGTERKVNFKLQYKVVTTGLSSPTSTQLHNVMKHVNNFTY